MAWHLRQAVIFFRWLQSGDKFSPREPLGIWGEYYSYVYRLKRRNRRRKQQLLAILNRYRESAAAMPDATVVLSSRYHIEWWNEAASNLLGLQENIDTGQRIDNIIRFPAFVRYLVKEDFSEKLEIASPVNEHVVLSVQIVPYGNNQKLLIARDHTKIRRLEEMRRDFVANVSHELKTPLTVIAGFLETIQSQQDPFAQRWQRSLTLMSEQAVRMQRIVEDLLYLSRLESGGQSASLDTVPVAVLLRSVRDESLLISGDRKHVFEFDVDESLALKGNAKELRSAFANLVQNAVAYTPAGGTISLRWCRRGATAVFSVHDTGIGIPQRHIPRLTERFYRVDISRSRESGGTGLGLAIVKHVLNRHQARLEIASEEGKGSTFSCIFPAGRVISLAVPAAMRQIG